jgi:hypothetical protein
MRIARLVVRVKPETFAFLDRGSLVAQPETPAPLSRGALRRHDPRWELGALLADAGISAGGGEQSPSYRDSTCSIGYKNTFYIVDIRPAGTMDRVAAAVIPIHAPPKHRGV